ncbi:MAG: response regulator, partial [Candidatus Omnitrophica bacterium]|nr:response regulator [Candidatus Omnitrophota bacterium]
MAKILVIDDEVDICSELAELLEGEGHVIHCAENAKEALLKLKDARYDLIFLDVLMPKMDGPSALREIRKKTKAAVVVMSAYFSPQIEADVLQEGAFACLKKPFKLSEIKLLIEK